MSSFFNSIAMSFSGGGYRAASFSLGSLSLFDKIGLLEKVKAISTVSGGTITGVKYAVSQIDGKDFQSFFKEYYKWLENDSLAKNAILHLKSNEIWKEKANVHKRKNPINAFAIEYNKFTNDRTLGDIQETIKNKKTHLDRVIFNATDFTNAMPFRFQNVNNSNRRLGNRNTDKIYKEYIGKLKLGDILAASSAFPGGFEPISLPNDFINENIEGDEIGLMDGGIIDNQGASSFLTVKPENNPYDLFFINDVASPYIEEPFNFARDNKFIRALSYLSSWPLLLLLIATTIFFFFKKWIFLYTISTIISFVMIVIQVILFYASSELMKETGINQVLKLPSQKLGYYILDRINSLVKMSGEVFLKNDRRQNASRIYSNFHNITTTATIYELRCKKEPGKPENVKEWDDIVKHTGMIPENMMLFAEKSSAFGTNLWFSDEKKELLDTIIACGEFTSCYNLISLLVRHHSDKIEGQDEKATDLFNKLIELWKALKKNPNHIIDERKKNFLIIAK